MIINYILLPRYLFIFRARCADKFGGHTADCAYGRNLYELEPYSLNTTTYHTIVWLKNVISNDNYNRLW